MPDEAVQPVCPRHGGEATVIVQIPHNTWPQTQSRTVLATSFICLHSWRHANVMDGSLYPKPANVHTTSWGKHIKNSCTYLEVLPQLCKVLLLGRQGREVGSVQEVQEDVERLLVRHDPSSPRDVSGVVGRILRHVQIGLGRACHPGSHGNVRSIPREDQPVTIHLHCVVLCLLQSRYTCQVHMCKGCDLGENQDHLFNSIQAS